MFSLWGCKVVSGRALFRNEAEKLLCFCCVHVLWNFGLIAGCGYTLVIVNKHMVTIISAQSTVLILQDILCADWIVVAD